MRVLLFASNLLKWWQWTSPVIAAKELPPCLATFFFSFFCLTSLHSPPRSSLLPAPSSLSFEFHVIRFHYTLPYTAGVIGLSLLLPLSFSQYLCPSLYLPLLVNDVILPFSRKWKQSEKTNKQTKEASPATSLIPSKPYTIFIIIRTIYAYNKSY